MVTLGNIFPYLNLSSFQSIFCLLNMILGGGGGTVRLTDTFLENNDAYKIFPFALMHLDLFSYMSTLLSLFGSDLEAKKRMAI